MATDPPPLPPFVRLGPAAPATPLVVAVPHAGRLYPAAVDRARAVGWPVLEQLEDRHADLLVAPLVAGGAVAIVARTARAWIDLNRAESDVAVPGDGGRASAREQAGLGLVPSRLGGRGLWRTRPDAAELAARIAQVHRPYHRAIADALAAARTAYGHALLLDCHSMPPLGRTPAAVIVLGDRHGASAASAVTAAAAAAAARAGFAMACNAPYAGGHTLDRHGRPADDIHALQVEVDRRLYLRPGLRDADGVGVARMGAWLCMLARACLDALELPAPAIAAE